MTGNKGKGRVGLKRAHAKTKKKRLVQDIIDDIEITEVFVPVLFVLLLGAIGTGIYYLVKWLLPPPKKKSKKKSTNPVNDTEAPETTSISDETTTLAATLAVNDKVDPYIIAGVLGTIALIILVGMFLKTMKIRPFRTFRGLEKDFVDKNSMFDESGYSDEPNEFADLQRKLLRSESGLKVEKKKPKKELNSGPQFERFIRKKGITELARKQKLDELKEQIKGKFAQISDINTRLAEGVDRKTEHFLTKMLLELDDEIVKLGDEENEVREKRKV